ncbi:cytochrome P450 [Trametes gibbosa]|nr:cytochrome P450 [Trametes gibbosa]
MTIKLLLVDHMPLSLTGLAIISVVIVFALLCSVHFIARSHGVKLWRKLPPGPKGLPILGNALQLPITFAEKTLYHWSTKYGDIVYFQIFHTPAIVLNSIEVARELLDKRSSRYSDRPRMVMLTELVQAPTLPGIPYGDRFRRRRKWMFDAVGCKPTLWGYRHIQRREVRALLLNLSEYPEQFTDHFHLYLAGIMLEITYGIPVKSLDDELVRLADTAINGTNLAGRAGSVPVDFLPMLKYIPTWMPGAGFKRNALVVREQVKAFLRIGYKHAISAIADGNTAPCIFGSILKSRDRLLTPADIEEIKALSFDVYGAGVETSRGTLASFILAMTLNKDVFRKAQAEIDEVVGYDRLPEFSDRGALPYVNAVLEEIYRWSPAFPMGIPHRVTTHDQYRGYDIPAGCMVIANTWAMTRDKDYYPEPETFRPERHLLPSTQTTSGKTPLAFEV